MRDHKIIALYKISYTVHEVKFLYFDSNSTELLSLTFLFLKKSLHHQKKNANRGKSTKLLHKCLCFLSAIVGMTREVGRWAAPVRATGTYGKGRQYTVKKAFRYSRPQTGCHLPNSLWAGIMTSFINIPAKGEFGK